MGRKQQKLKTINKLKQESTVNGILLDVFGGRMDYCAGSEVESILTMLYNNRGYLITNQGDLLDTVYSTNGIISKFIEMPVQDAFGSGFKIKSAQLNNEDINRLNTKMVIEDDIGALTEAFIWKRLFGGGGLIVVTNSDYSKSFKEDEIKEGDPLIFKPFSRWDLYKDGQKDLAHANFQWDSFENSEFKYFNKTLSRSRMFVLKGATATTKKKIQTGGWGLSELEKVVPHINEFIKVQQLIFEILSEYKIDVLKLDGFHATALTNSEALHKRAQEMAMIKEMRGMLMLDGKDSFEARTLTFAGIPEILTRIENHLSAIFRIPATRFWGIGASGFSSGKEDIEAYNIMLKSHILKPAHPILLRMTQLRCLQLFGFIPDDLSIEFNSFKDASVADTELEKSGNHTRLLDARREGIITDDQYRSAVDSAGLLPIKIGEE